MKFGEKIKELFKCRRKTKTVSFKDNYIHCGLPVISLYNDNTQLNFIVDSGSTVNVINKDAVKYLHYTETGMGAEVATGGNSATGDLINIPLHDTNIVVNANFLVLNLDKQFTEIKAKEQVTVHGIIGCKFLETIEGVLNFKTYTLTY